MHSPFKAFEHEAWQGAASHYDEAFSRLTRQVIPSVLDVLEIEQGSALLDIACGPGYLAAEAHARGAKVTGVDFSSQMVARARVHNPGIEFYEGDAEDLKQFADASFDAVAMNFGILHLDQPEKAISAIFRVLKPGGRAAFTVWAAPEKAVAFGMIVSAIAQHGAKDTTLPPALPFFHFSEGTNSRDIFTGCGFVEPQSRIVEQSWQLDSPEVLFNAFLKGTARMGGLLRQQSSEQLENIRQHIIAACAPYLREGKLLMPMPAYLAWAKKG